jgi:hypothetical protein
MLSTEVKWENPELRPLMVIYGSQTFGAFKLRINFAE